MGNWTVSRIYLYLVALITFTVLLSNFIGLVRSIPDYLLGGEMYGPATPVRQELYSSNPDKPEMITYTEEEMKAYLEERNKESQRIQKSIYLRNIVTNTLSFLVLLPIHIYYLKLAFKSDKKIISA